MFDISKIEVQTGTRGETYRPFFNVMVLGNDKEALVTLAVPGFKKDNIKMRVVHYQTGTALEVTSLNTIADDVLKSNVFDKRTDEQTILESIQKGISGTIDKPINTKVMVKHDDHETKVDFKVDYQDGMIIIKILESKICCQVGGDELKFEDERKQEQSKKESTSTSKVADRFDRLMKKYFPEDGEKESDRGYWKYYSTNGSDDLWKIRRSTFDMFDDFFKDFDDFWTTKRRK